MHLLLPAAVLELPSGLLDPEVTPPPTPLHDRPVPLVVRRTGSHRQAVCAEPQVGWEGQLDEEGGHVEDAERQVAGVFRGGEGEGEAERGEELGESFAGEEEADLGGRVGERVEDVVEDVVGEEEEGGGCGVRVVVA